MLVSSYELQIVEDWSKHFGAGLVSAMLADLRAELPVDRFGLVRKTQKIGNRVILVQLPDWAKNARDGVVELKGSSRKREGREVA